METDNENWSFFWKGKMMLNIYKFEKNIRVKFKNKSLLVAALTHKSSNQKKK